jgi:primosomal replication protein N
MSSYILDKAYAIEDTSGVGAYLVVVQGTQAGAAKLPTAANAEAILGVTVHSQSLQGANVAVRKAGIARVKAAGAISLGAPVNVAGTTGKVKAISETQGTKINCLGFAETAAAADGDVIEVFLAPHERTAP